MAIYFLKNPPGGAGTRGGGSRPGPRGMMFYSWWSLLSGGSSWAAWKFSTVDPPAWMAITISSFGDRRKRD